VLLIDELDKCDIDLPGDLLNVLERGQFDIPELARHSRDLVAVRIDDSEDTLSVNKGHVSCVNFPIIIITSNGERDFSPAFLRRCIRHHMNIPTEAELAEIVSAHLNRSLNERQMAEVSDFAARIAGGSSLAVDQLLNTVFLLAGEDAADSAQLESAKQVLLQELSGS
jgi:MoxR-like ATPase